MHKFSKRQSLIQDLFITLVYLDFEDTDNLLDSHLNVPSVPSLGMIISPNNGSRKMFLDSILEDEADICDLLQYVLSKQYLNDCPVPRTREKYDLVQLFDMCDDNFKQAVRTTKTVFIWLLGQIYLHPIFYSNSK